MSSQAPGSAIGGVGETPLRFGVVIEKASDNYSAYVPDLPGCVATGDSVEDTEYNLDAILAVGYRVRSPRGVQFRRWATTVLREYLVKGFAMDAERLKDPDRDYFDELLERIRDIRRQLMTLADWDWVLDRLLAGNELSFHV